MVARFPFVSSALDGRFLASHSDAKDRFPELNCIVVQYAGLNVSPSNGPVVSAPVVI